MNLRVALVKASKKYGYQFLAETNSSRKRKYCDGYATPIKIMESYKRKQGKQS